MQDPAEDDRLMRGLLEGELPAQDLSTAFQRMRQDAVFREQLLDLAAVRALLPSLRDAVALPPSPECAAIRKLFEDYRIGRAGAAEVGRLSGHLAGCPKCALVYEVSNPQHLAAERRRSPPPKPRDGKLSWRLTAGLVLSIGAIVSIYPIFFPAAEAPSAPSSPISPSVDVDARPKALAKLMAAWDIAEGEQERWKILGGLRKFADLVPESRLWAMAREEKSSKCRQGLYALKLGTTRTDVAEYRNAIQRELEECKHGLLEPNRGPLSSLFAGVGDLETSIGEDFMLGVLARLSSPDDGFPDFVLGEALEASYYGFQHSDKMLAQLGRIGETHRSPLIRTQADFVIADMLAKRGEHASLARCIDQFLPRLASTDAVIRNYARIAIERHGDPFRMLCAAGRAWEASPKLAASIAFAAGRKMAPAAMAAARLRAEPPRDANRKTRVDADVDSRSAGDA